MPDLGYFVRIGAKTGSRLLSPDLAADVADTQPTTCRIAGHSVGRDTPQTDVKSPDRGASKRSARRGGCTKAQGFHFSGPMGAEAADVMIRDGYPLDLEAPRH
jgi:predicted signal transduction protein with EAL and GGDEF domain